MTMTEETMTVMIGQGHPVHVDEAYREIDRLRCALAQAQRSNGILVEALSRRDSEVTVLHEDMGEMIHHYTQECRRSRRIIMTFVEHEGALITVEDSADAYSHDLVRDLVGLVSGQASDAGEILRACWSGLDVVHAAVRELRTMHRIVRDAMTYIPGDEGASDIARIIERYRMADGAEL